MLAGCHSRSTSKASQDTHTQTSLVKDFMIITENLCSASELAQFISLTSKTGLSSLPSTDNNKNRLAGSLKYNCQAMNSEENSHLLFFRVVKQGGQFGRRIALVWPHKDCTHQQPCRGNYMKHLCSCRIR